LPGGEVVLFVVVPYLAIWLGRISIGDGLHRLGDPSYGMYIYGWPIGQLLTERMSSGPVWTFMTANLVIALLVGLVSWHLVERPALSAARDKLRQLRPAAAT